MPKMPRMQVFPSVSFVSFLLRLGSRTLVSNFGESNFFAPLPLAPDDHAMASRPADTKRTSRRIFTAVAILCNMDSE